MNAIERESLKHLGTRIPIGYRELQRGEIILEGDLAIMKEKGSLNIEEWMISSGKNMTFGVTWNKNSYWRMIRKKD